ncbi:MAG: DUF3365 domain-containing protein [Gloeomargarita sp. DG02_1_bins_92]
MRRVLMVMLMLLGLTLGWSLPVQAAVDPAALGKAVTAIERLDQLRTGLASGVENTTTEPTLTTFKEVCAPVGQQARAIAQTNGWQVRQVAARYRNPQHQPQNLTEEAALAELAEHPQVQAFWETDDQGIHYFRRIDVQASCLVCHGARDKVPAFVKNRYPQDLAYDFQVGDLRGMYHVLIPALQMATAPLL